MDALPFLPGIGAAVKCAAEETHRPKPLRFVWHHVMPRTCGGPTTPDNLESVCDNCFPYDASVHAGNIEGASRRWYEGALVEVAMADGRRVTGTPNHPIMTSYGWTLLGLVKQGDYAITYTPREEDATSVRDVQGVPAKIGEIFDALCVAGSIRIPAPLVDFHGERPDSNVDVVSANGELWNSRNVTISQLSDDLILPSTDSKTAFLSGDGEPFTLCVTSRPAPDGVMGSSGQGGAALRAEGFHAQTQGIAAGTQHDPSGSQQCVDCVCGNGGFLGEFECGFSGTVSLNPVVGVNRMPFAGHVYNLQTSTGSYTVDDIVVHNCHYGIHVLLHELACNEGKLTDHWHLGGTGRYAVALRGYEAALAAGTLDKIPNEGSD